MYAVMCAHFAGIHAKDAQVLFFWDSQTGEDCSLMDILIILELWYTSYNFLLTLCQIDKIRFT